MPRGSVARLARGRFTLLALDGIPWFHLGRKKLSCRDQQ
jgi:hypothetical protein